MDFVLGNDCQTVLAQGTCDLSVQFRPTGVGQRTATIMVQKPNGDIVMISLEGTGV